MITFIKGDRVVIESPVRFSRVDRGALIPAEMPPGVFGTVEDGDSHGNVLVRMDPYSACVWIAAEGLLRVEDLDDIARDRRGFDWLDEAIAASIGDRRAALQAATELLGSGRPVGEYLVAADWLLSGHLERGEA